jgi:methylated-DNA-protein-cysteine methyltransferase-like protein
MWTWKPTPRRSVRRAARAKAAASPALHLAIYRMVRRVPHGRVVTYGQVARLIGRPRAARAVGRALRVLEKVRARGVPWHRVVNGSGRISYRDRFGPEMQRELLEDEGIVFDARGRLDLARLAWPGPSRPRARKASDPPPRRQRRGTTGSKRSTAVSSAKLATRTT